MRWAIGVLALVLPWACGGADDKGRDGAGAADAIVDAASPDGTSLSDAPGVDAPDALPDVLADLATDPAEAPDVEIRPDADAQTPSYPAAIPLSFPLDGQPLLPVRVDGGEPRPFVIDTGAIRTAADPALLHDVANGVGTATFDLGDGVVLPDYEVLAADLAEAVDVIGVPLQGLIGQDLFGQLWFGVDYRARQGYVAPTAPDAAPPGYATVPPVELPYDLVQGYPVVTVEVAGATLRLIADTGSGVTLVDASLLPPAVLEAGLVGYTWYTSYGSDPGTLVRLPDLELAGRSVPGTWAVAIPHQHHLSQLFSLMGIQVDGFLGYPVYREFFVGVRGADHAYDLWPCAEPDPLAATEWDRVAVEVRRDAGATLIDMVFVPSDAATGGVQPQERLLRVDGADADALALDDLRRVLRGTPGEVRTLTLLREGLEVDVTVTVDHLLPTE